MAKECWTSFNRERGSCLDDCGELDCVVCRHVTNICHYVILLHRPFKAKQKTENSWLDKTFALILRMYIQKYYAHLCMIRQGLLSGLHCSASFTFCYVFQMHNESNMIQIYVKHGYKQSDKFVKRHADSTLNYTHIWDKYIVYSNSIVVYSSKATSNTFFTSLYSSIKVFFYWYPQCSSTKQYSLPDDVTILYVYVMNTCLNYFNFYLKNCLRQWIALSSTIPISLGHHCYGICHSVASSLIHVCDWSYAANIAPFMWTRS